MTINTRVRCHSPKREDGKAYWESRLRHLERKNGESQICYQRKEKEGGNPSNCGKKGPSRATKKVKDGKRQRNFRVPRGKENSPTTWTLKKITQKFAAIDVYKILIRGVKWVMTGFFPKETGRGFCRKERSVTS